MFYSEGYKLRLIIDLSFITFNMKRIKPSYINIIRVT